MDPIVLVAEAVSGAWALVPMGYRWAFVSGVAMSAALAWIDRVFKGRAT